MIGHSPYLNEWSIASIPQVLQTWVPPQTRPVVGSTISIHPEKSHGPLQPAQTITVVVGTSSALPAEQLCTGSVIGMASRRQMRQLKQALR
jgi:hypothetical protein